jgi:hypothetical protein
MDFQIFMHVQSDPHKFLRFLGVTPPQQPLPWGEKPGLVRPEVENSTCAAGSVGFR